MPFLFLLLSFIFACACTNSRATNNMDRVDQAKKQYDSSLAELFQNKGLALPPKKLYLRAFKQEKQLEVWAADDKEYLLIKTYAFTATSGKPGPKCREGDLQIPEGLFA